MWFANAVIRHTRYYTTANLRRDKILYSFFSIMCCCSRRVTKKVANNLCQLPHRQIKYPVDFDDELKTRKRQ